METGLPGLQIMLLRFSEVELTDEINSTDCEFETAVTNLEFTVISKLNDLLTTD